MSLKNVTIHNTVPSSITSAFVDGDPIAYAGACAAEKTFYQMINKHTGEKSEELKSAKEAAQFLSDLDSLGYGNPDDWERISYKKVNPVSTALALTKSVLNDYIRTAGNNIKHFEGYLTERGAHKNKDIEGIENRYQGNRANLETPTHLDACRDWLVTQGFKVLKGGFEADAIVIAKAEKCGKTGLIMSIDKDLQQAEGTYMVNMKYDKDKRQFWIAHDKEGVGDLWYCPIKKKYIGMGFKWLMLQAMAGDRADGYLGLKGVGAKGAYDLIQTCKTKQECLELMLAFYKDKVGDQFTYKSWDGQDLTIPYHKLMEQHIWLAYQERSPKDEFKLSKYIKV